MGSNKPDICIVGSGPAGLAVASRACRSGKSVLLVESGGGPSNARDLLQGELADAATSEDRIDPLLINGPPLHQPWYLQHIRTRAPGGYATKWCVRPNQNQPPTVRVAKPEHHQFLAHESFGIPEWQLCYSELESYLSQAGTFLGLSNPTFAASDNEGQLRLDPEIFSPRYFYFAKASTIYEERLADVIGAESVDFRVGWTLVEIRTDKARRRIVSLVFVDDYGKQFLIRPSQVVIAAGGVETCRILLNAVQDGQLANPNDTLGRWFFDHPHTRMGLFAPKTPVGEFGRFHDFHVKGGHYVLGHYALTENAVRNEDLLQFSLTLVGVPRSSTTRAASAVNTLYNFRKRRLSPRSIPSALIAAGTDPASAFAQLRRNMKGTPRHSAALGGWSNPRSALTQVDVFEVEVMSAQRPSPDNRVRLSQEQDRHGRRRACLQWSWSRPEVDSYWRSVDLTRRELNRLGIGDFVGADKLGMGMVPKGSTGGHEMGGTRMTECPADGVVDPNCCHHQTENLFVAGPSVFPSSAGFANPLLTIVAMSLRLGDYLAG